jgi:hypothetical protein
VALRFLNCTLVGAVLTFNCATNAHLVVSPPVAQPQTGHLTNISCTMTHGACVITVTGEVTSQYVNATGVLTVLAAGQALTATWGPACDGLLGTTGGGISAPTLTNNTGGNLPYTTTSSPKPSIT